MLDHERVGAYHHSLELLDVADEILEVSKLNAHLRSQLDRAATSIVLNIAEGAGEFSPREKQRFYRMARRSTNECAALFDILKRRAAAPAELLAVAYERTRIVISSLVRLIQATEKRMRNESSAASAGAGAEAEDPAPPRTSSGPR
jgi:four helix bundle protein